MAAEDLRTTCLRYIKEIAYALEPDWPPLHSAAFHALMRIESKKEEWMDVALLFLGIDEQARCSREETEAERRAQEAVRRALVTSETTAETKTACLTALRLLLERDARTRIIMDVAPQLLTTKNCTASHAAAIIRLIKSYISKDENAVAITSVLVVAMQRFRNDDEVLLLALKVLESILDQAAGAARHEAAQHAVTAVTSIATRFVLAKRQLTQSANDVIAERAWELLTKLFRVVKPTRAPKSVLSALAAIVAPPHAEMRRRLLIAGLQAFSELTNHLERVTGDEELAGQFQLLGERMFELAKRCNVAAGGDEQLAGLICQLMSDCFFYGSNKRPQGCAKVATRMLQTYAAHDATVVRRCAGLLRNVIFTSKEETKAFVANHGVSALVQACRFCATRDDCVEGASLCVLFRGLAHSYAEVLVEAGAIQAILQMMQQHSAIAPRMAKWACKTLASLCAKLPAAREIIDASHGLRVLGSVSAVGVPVGAVETPSRKRKASCIDTADAPVRKRTLACIGAIFTSVAEKLEPGNESAAA